jgi:predicted unusual protein kinase regulating ubiquinone biosynthesis (AarF/ABC1/UbiB family)
MLARETDLSHEASCIARMAADFHDEPAVVFPPVRAELSTATILTMGFMDGVKVSDKEGLARLGLAPEAVAEVLVKAFYRAIFVHRFFHADPHPGNFLVQAAPTASGGVTPRLVVLDLGSATPLMPHIADGATHALSGFLARDDARILEGLERIGFVAEDGDRGLLQATISRYFEKLLSLNLTDLSQVDFRTAERFIDPDLKFRELRALMRSIVYPEGWFELERTAVMLFALSAQLAPRLNTISLGLPWVMRFLASNPMPIVSRAPAPSSPGLLSEAALSASAPATPEQVPKGPTAALSAEPLAQLAPLGQAR